MDVSVVVPAHNEEKTVSRCITALLGQSYPRSSYEIIVVDDGSTDGTASAVRKHRGVKLIKQPRGGAGKARNAGVRAAHGEYILFTDADCVPDKNWIKEMVSALRGAAAVQGTYRTNQRSLVARFAQREIEERHRKLRDGAMAFATGSAAVRKDVFDSAGGFATAEGVFGEDTDLSYRIGENGRIAFAPRAFVYHEHPETLTTYLKQKHWRGVMTGAFLFRKHGRKLAKDPYKGKTFMVQIAYSGLILASGAAFLIGNVPSILPAAFIAAWLLLALPFTLRSLRKDLSVGLASPLLLFLRDVAIGFGVLRGLLRRA